MLFSNESVFWAHFQSGSFGSSWVSSLTASQIHQADLTDLRQNLKKRMKKRQKRLNKTWRCTSSPQHSSDDTLDSLHSDHKKHYITVNHRFRGGCGQIRLKQLSCRRVWSITIQYRNTKRVYWEPFRMCCLSPCRVSSGWRWCWRRRESGCLSHSCWLQPQSYKQKKKKHDHQHYLCCIYWSVQLSAAHSRMTPKSLSWATWLCFQSPSDPGCHCRKWRLV